MGGAHVITFALGIPHTPWKRERVESFARLCKSLGIGECPRDEELRPNEHEISYAMRKATRFFTERCPNWQWSGDMWRWAAETDATHFLSLQDDVIPSPNFWPELRAMVEAKPDEVIGLESVHPECTEAARNGVRWLATSDGLIGVGYVLPIWLLREFLEWRATRLCKGAVESITEDSLLSLWCLTTEQPIYHPVPTIIDHDTSLKSTYGNDTHSHRRPVVTWKDYAVGDDPKWWDHPATHVGHFYGGWIAQLGRRWVKGATDLDWKRWRDA